jgi:Protein of unknown function (DUF3108)
MESQSMFMDRLNVQPPTWRLGSWIVISQILLCAPALAESKLDAKYVISAAGIPIGKSEITVQIDNDKYTASATGRANGFFSILVSGEGSVHVDGVVSEAGLQPKNFTASIKKDNENSEVKMVIDGGSVVDFTAESSVADQDRVPLTDAHRHGIVDPLTAILLPAGKSEALSSDVCQRSLPIFDGRRRYDLDLSFKRKDELKLASGYQGPVVVCGVKFKPIAGHHSSSLIVKYLSEGRELELWLAPIAGTHILAPVRMTTTNTIGNLVVDAEQFNVVH